MMHEGVEVRHDCTREEEGWPEATYMFDHDNLVISQWPGFRATYKAQVTRCGKIHWLNFSDLTRTSNASSALFIYQYNTAVARVAECSTYLPLFGW